MKNGNEGLSADIGIDLALTRTHKNATGRKKRGCKGEGDHGPSGITVRSVFEQVPISLFLANEKFITAWTEWIQYRLECGQQMRWPTNVRSFQRSMNLCERMGAERAVAAIDYSIERSYRGLFERPQFERKQPAKKIDPWDGLK